MVRSRTLGAVHAGLRGANGLLRGGEREIGVGGGDGDFEFGALQGGFRFAPAARSPTATLAWRRPKSKGSQLTSTPTALPQVVPKLLVPRTGPEIDGMHTLRQQHAEDVVAGGAVDLRERVGLRQVGGPRQAYAGGGGIDLLLRNADRRIVLRARARPPARRSAAPAGACAEAVASASQRRTGEQTQRFPVTRYSPSMSSRNSSRTLLFAASSAFRPSGSGAVDLAQRFAVALLPSSADSPSFPDRAAADTGCPGLMR